MIAHWLGINLTLFIWLGFLLAARGDFDLSRIPAPDSRYLAFLLLAAMSGIAWLLVLWR